MDGVANSTYDVRVRAVHAVLKGLPVSQVARAYHMAHRKSFATLDLMIAAAQ
jgi:hypothetical protein